MDDAEAGGADDADEADGPDDAAGDCELFSSGAGTEGVDAGETSVMIGKLHAFFLGNKFRGFSVIFQKISWIAMFHLVIEGSACVDTLVLVTVLSSLVWSASNVLSVLHCSWVLGIPMLILCIGWYKPGSFFIF